MNSELSCGAFGLEISNICYAKSVVYGGDTRIDFELQVNCHGLRVLGSNSSGPLGAARDPVTIASGWIVEPPSRHTRMLDSPPRDREN